MDNAIIDPLAKAKGHGAAHSGTHHYVTHKVSSIALLLLGAWLILQLHMLANLGVSQIAVVAWLQSPINAILTVLFTLTACRHFYGLIEEVILDYVPHEGARIVTLLSVKFITILLAFSTSYAILFMSFVGGDTSGVM